MRSTIFESFRTFYFPLRLMCAISVVIVAVFLFPLYLIGSYVVFEWDLWLEKKRRNGNEVANGRAVFHRSGDHTRAHDNVN